MRNNERVARYSVLLPKATNYERHQGVDTRERDVTEDMSEGSAKSGDGSLDDSELFDGCGDNRQGDDSDDRAGGSQQERVKSKEGALSMAKQRQQPGRKTKGLSQAKTITQLRSERAIRKRPDSISPQTTRKSA